MEDPGKTLGIVGLIAAFFVPVAGLIVSIIGRSKSKKAGFDNKCALWGIIVSAVSLVASLVFFLILMFSTIASIDSITSNAVEHGQSAQELRDTTDNGRDTLPGDDSIADDWADSLTQEQKDQLKDQGIDLDDPEVRENLNNNLGDMKDWVDEYKSDMPDTDGDGTPDEWELSPGW